jgi:hypothetical protein
MVLFFEHFTEKASDFAPRGNFALFNQKGLLTSERFLENNKQKGSLKKV